MNCWWAVTIVVVIILLALRLRRPVRLSTTVNVRASTPTQLPSRRSGRIEIESVETESKVACVSVNYHFLRSCNYRCKFCFHTAKGDLQVLSFDQARHGLNLLQHAGMRKINFSGGEPFLKAELLAQMARHCKETLKLESVSIGSLLGSGGSIVSNGSLITREWMQRHGRWIDILAVSCDSFDDATNQRIGRSAGATSIRSHSHVEQLRRIAKWCGEFGIMFKINTVVNFYNVDEDMNSHIRELNPVRWKVFQCLLIDGENVGEEALRDARECEVDDKQFEQFVSRHASLKCLVPESNRTMRDSYLILDERMRFLDCTGGAKAPSPSILDSGGVAAAIAKSGFDHRMFGERGGQYKWTKQ